MIRGRPLNASRLTESHTVTLTIRSTLKSNTDPILIGSYIDMYNTYELPSCNTEQIKIDSQSGGAESLA